MTTKSKFSGSHHFQVSPNAPEGGAPIIVTEISYDDALEELDRLLDKPRRSKDDTARLKALGKAISDYETEAYPMGTPNAVDMVKFIMDQHELKQVDLVEIFGSRSRVSEFLNYRRRLTMDAVWALHKKYKAPLECLIKPYDLVS